MKLWRSKTKLLCETSFKNEALKIKNEAFLRDFLQKWSFEAQKRSFCARLPWKMKLWRSKTKHFCETSFKNEALKLKNEAFLRDFLQKWSFEDQKRSISARLPSKMTCWSDTWPQNSNTFQRFLSGCFKSTAPATKKLSRGIRSPVTATRKPFHGFCVGGFKHRHRKARNPCACHAKRIVSEPLLIPHACQRFCNPHKLLRLPRILKHIEIPAPATRKPLWTSKSGPRPWCFNDFDFQILLARRRGANFADFNFQKSSEALSFYGFDFQIAISHRCGAHFVDLNFQKCSRTLSF